MATATLRRKATRAVRYSDAAIVRRALRVLDRDLKKPGSYVGAPAMAANFFRLQLARRKAEVFAVMLLDTRHAVIGYRELFQGTIDSATVYPREVVRAVIEANAAAIILAHNHPSGIPEPSEADRTITLKLAKALALIDVRVLDHIIVAGTRHVSLGERGLL